MKTTAMMTMNRAVFGVAAVLCSLIAHEASAETTASLRPTPNAGRTVVIASGVYRPLFPSSPSQATVPVASFRLDRVPVTNGEFLRFVQSHREWARDQVNSVVAEPGYLAHWATNDSLGASVEEDQPVVNVSWFAARAYCLARGDGARLPTESEWELAAAASRTKTDGSSDPAWRAELLTIYSKPATSKLPRVGTSGAPNFWGVRDMHGVVWEWVQDFNNAIAQFKSSGSDGLRFCGANGSAGARGDGTDFLAFERTALRSSLRATFVIKNLGFRCAANLSPTTKR